MWHPEPPVLLRHCLHQAPALCPSHSPVATSSKGTAGHSSLHLHRRLSCSGEQGVNSPSVPSSHSGQMSSFASLMETNSPSPLSASH